MKGSYRITIEPEGEDPITFRYTDREKATNRLNYELEKFRAGSVSVRYELVDFCLTCGHLEEHHVGYVAGPDIREWCEGSGRRTDLGEQERYPICPCTEFVEGGTNDSDLSPATTT